MDHAGLPTPATPAPAPAAENRPPEQGRATPHRTPLTPPAITTYEWTRARPPPNRPPAKYF
ncbi:hypothetical protein GCM10010246_32910 [Streptomyces cuspidosporus]|uniref:Uncharacterized protein n=1 Tax=Streptomyces cuspidosporus TaxID=66882 RepID=A0ABP5T379_9ACTN